MSGEIERAMEAAVEARLEHAAAAALDHIQHDQQWSDWLAIGELLVFGRDKARRLAGINRPLGTVFNRLFGAWLNQHARLRALDRTTRAHAIWCADRRVELEAWRAVLSTNQRQDLNHPTAVRRRFMRGAPSAAKPSARDRFEAELIRLEGENANLRREIARLKKGS